MEVLVIQLGHSPIPLCEPHKKQLATMKQRVQIIVFLALSQAACLAIGLWMESRLTQAVAQWSELEKMKATSAENGTTQQNATAKPSLPSNAMDEIVVSAQTLREAANMTRPLAFVWIVLLQAATAYLILSSMVGKHTQKEMRSQEANLSVTKELVRTRDAVIFGLAKLAESRDPDTGQHLERIALYSTRLATALRRHPHYRDVVTPGFVRSIGIGSALHDIGKVGVVDSILLKPGALTQEERAEMQTHAALGGECIRQIEQRLGNSNFLEMAREIAYCHHERWDGAGYPAGISGKQIPLAARIVAIVDVYDALASKRTYKDPIPHEKCIEIIKQEAGKHFDPHILEVFLSINKQIQSAFDRYRDAPRLDSDLRNVRSLLADNDSVTQPNAAAPSNNTKEVEVLETCQEMQEEVATFEAKTQASTKNSRNELVCTE